MYFTVSLSAMRGWVARPQQPLYPTAASDCVRFSLEVFRPRFGRLTPRRSSRTAGTKKGGASTLEEKPIAQILAATTTERERIAKALDGPLVTQLLEMLR
jgi:hypothetical protein